MNSTKTVTITKSGAPFTEDDYRLMENLLKNESRSSDIYPVRTYYKRHYSTLSSMSLSPLVNLGKWIVIGITAIIIVSIIIK